MRAGNLIWRVKFFPRVTKRDEYGSSTDTWPVATISTRGEVRYTGGAKTLSAEEKFYSKYVELYIRYRPEVVETMRVQLDDSADMYEIGYIEVLGRKEGLRLTLEKLNL